MPKKEKKTFISIEPVQHFWVNGGPILSDLKELHKAFKKEITDEQFKFHVNGDRNDFAAWVKDSLGDSKCATALKRAKKKETALKVVGECLKDYKK